MRVTFLTQEDPLYILPFFERFLTLDLNNIEITGIFACRSMGNRKRSKLLAELFSLYRPLGFSKLLCLQLRERLLASSGLSRLAGTPHSIRDVAKSSHIPYYRIDNPNKPDSLKCISSHTPDVLVSVACPHILKAPLLKLPSQAAINIHHAPLPKYRGMMPTFWQMFHGESSAGVTIHTMSEAVDEGNILHQSSISIRRGESMHALIRRSKRYGAEAMQQVLSQFAAGSPPTPMQAATQYSYFTFPTPNEMRIFRSRGLRAI